MDIQWANLFKYKAFPRHFGICVWLTDIGCIKISFTLFSNLKQEILLSSCGNLLYACTACHKKLFWRNMDFRLWLKWNDLAPALCQSLSLHSFKLPLKVGKRWCKYFNLYNELRLSMRNLTAMILQLIFKSVDKSYFPW